MRVARVFALVAAVAMASACHGDRVGSAPRPATHPVGAPGAPPAPEPRAPTAPHVPAFPDPAVGDAEVDAARDAVLGERTARTALQRVPGARWDGRTPPRYLDRIVERLGMTQGERDLLVKNGFVVLGGTFFSYGEAFDFIHRRELPLYVSADALLYALYRSHAEILKSLETDNARRLGKILAAMHDELPKARRAYGAVTAADVDLYLAVARNLLEARIPFPGQPPALPSTIGGGDVARPLLQRMMKDHGRSTVVKLFGRDRVVDWAAFYARGFYRDDLEFYWAAVTWLSRIELNLVSRGSKAASPKLDATESPREATLALALADLASRSGAMSELSAFDARLRSFTGPREDVTPGDLAELGRGIDLTHAVAASEELRRRIGDRYRRTMPTESVEDPTKLPVVATMLGVGITPDGHPLAALANDRELRGADLAYALGHDAARAHVKDVAPNALAEARRRMNEARRGPDAYASWLGVVRSLPEAGADGSDRAHAPSFFASPAYADARMSSALAAFGAIRNVYALITPVVYRTGSCTIPDAYVEPHAPFFDALTSYAATMEKIAPSLASFVDEEERREREAANAPPPQAKPGRKPKQPESKPVKPLTEEEKKAQADNEAKWALRSKWSEASHAYMDVRARDGMEQPARFARTVAALRAIVEDERAGRPLSTAQLAFLGMVSEYHPYNMYDDERTPPRYNGWYTRLFVGRTHGYERAVYTGDVFASAKTNTRMQLGALEPRLAVFIVDTQGEPRAVVGPVTRAFERVITSSDDGKAAEHVDPNTPAVPWEARYAAPLREVDDGLDPAIAREESGAFTIEVHSAKVLEGAVLERVDAHGATLATGPIVDAKPFKELPVTMTPRPGATTAPSIRFARLRYADGSTREIQLWTKEGADITPSAARR